MYKNISKQFYLPQIVYLKSVVFCNCSIILIGFTFIYFGWQRQNWCIRFWYAGRGLLALLSSAPVRPSLTSTTLNFYQLFLYYYAGAFSRVVGFSDCPRTFVWLNQFGLSVTRPSCYMSLSIWLGLLIRGSLVFNLSF